MERLSFGREQGVIEDEPTGRLRLKNLYGLRILTDAGPISRAIQQDGVEQRGLSRSPSKFSTQLN